MSTNKRKQKRLRNLWQRNPHCAWCGCKTRLIHQKGGALPGDAATLDHIRSKLDPLRRAGGRIGKPWEENVLACYGCNHERGRQEYLALPIEEQRRRSQCYPIALRPLTERIINAETLSDLRRRFGDAGASDSEGSGPVQHEALRQCDAGEDQAATADSVGCEMELRPAGCH